MFGLSTALSLGTGLIGAWSQERTNKRNVALSREQMGFQEDMSNTSHQREVEDLRKAGLNPILSAGGQGASTPLGASATIEDSISKGAGTAMQALQTKSTLQLQKEQAENVKAQSNLTDIQTLEKIQTLPAIKEESKARAEEAKAKAIIYNELAKGAGNVRDMLRYLETGVVGDKLYDLKEKYLP